MALGARGSRRTSGMPYAAACTHPFDAARLDDAFRSRGLFIGDPPLEKERQRRDAGMRMKADRRHVLRIDVEIIQKHKRLDEPADVGRADEPGDRSMRMAARTVGDAASKCFGSGLGKWLVHLEAARAVAGRDALARAAFKAAVHHSRSSISVRAGASSSASPASTSPPW